MGKWFSLLLTVLFLQGLSQTEYHYLVSFKFKSSYLELNSPEDFLTSKAVSKRLSYNKSIDSTDLPINDLYLKTIDSHSLTIEAKSKWLNSVVVLTSVESMIDSLNEYTFVESVKLIGVNNPNKQVLDKFDYGSNENQSELINIKYGHNKGYTGEGIDIAIIDAGFKNLNSNPFFDSLFIQNRVLSDYNFVSNSNIDFTGHSHGAHVASVLASNINGSYVGSAPHANYHFLISEDINQENLIEEFHLIEAIEYFGVPVWLSGMARGLLVKIFVDSLVFFYYDCH